MISFGSDNHAGAHPDILRAIESANAGSEPAYGSDSFTEKARAKFRAEFADPSLEVLFAFSGTGANVLSLVLMLEPNEAVLCSDVAHLHVDEAGAPERLTGNKIITVPSVNGKISPTSLLPFLSWIGDHHRPQPKLLSLTQSTEYGTVYSLEEMRVLRDLAKKHGVKIHIDGARLANAMISLRCSWKEFYEASGADVISFGGTKNGLLFGEVVLLRAGAQVGQRNLLALQKQFLQQASKMRFLAAQFLAYFSFWENNAQAANAAARELAAILAENKEIKITKPVEANAVFAIFPEAWRLELAKKFRFYTWDALSSEVRLMCSYATTEQELKAFREALAALKRSS
jgi:threonine aldolase